MGKKLSDEEIKSQKYGKLSAIRRIGKDKHGHYLWECRCDCGNVVIAAQARLRSGRKRSCGCLHKDAAQKRAKPYSHRERLYVLWMGMRQRCSNPNNSSYAWYGGKGVTVCDEWENNYLSFKKWALETGYDESLPRGMQTIERKNVGKGYSPDNCEWKTIQQQQRNKGNTKLFEYNGESHTVVEWSEILGLKHGTLHSRVLGRGWGIKEAIETPAREQHEKIFVDYRGEGRSISEISQESGVPRYALKVGIRKGKTAEDIIRGYNKRKDLANKKYEYSGKILTIREWADELGVPRQTIYSRLKAGMPHSKVFAAAKDYRRKQR